MAIANVGTRGEVGFPAQSGTLGVTINAATNLAVVTVGWWDGTPITPGPFSIDGTGFTEVISKFDDTNYMYTSIWQLVNPSTGSQTLSYNMAENPSDPSQIIIEFFSGVDTASPIRGSGAADQGDGSPCTTPAITSAVGDLGFCVVCSYNVDAVADGGSQTEYDNQSQSTTFLATGWLAGASPSITMQGNGANDSICACSIQASATTEALAGTIAASSTVSGLLPVTRSVIGSIAASSTVTGILPITRSLIGSVGASSSVSGILPLSRTLLGVVGASSSVSGVLPITRTLSGTIAASSTLSGAVTLSEVMLGTVAAVTTVAGELTVASTADVLAGAISASSTVSGVLVLTLPMAGSISASSTVTGSLKKLITLIASLTGASTVTSDLTVTATVVARELILLSKIITEKELTSEMITEKILMSMITTEKELTSEIN